VDRFDSPDLGRVSWLLLVEGRYAGGEPASNLSIFFSFFIILLPVTPPIA
jgi:hypothetical protein